MSDLDFWTSIGYLGDEIELGCNIMYVLCPSLHRSAVSAKLLQFRLGSVLEQFSALASIFAIMPLLPRRRSASVVSTPRWIFLIT